MEPEVFGPLLGLYTLVEVRAAESTGSGNPTLRRSV